MDIVIEEKDPTKLYLAIESPNSQMLIDAMNNEKKSMKNNDIELMSIYEGEKPTGCMIFTTKKDAEGKLVGKQVDLLAKFL